MWSKFRLPQWYIFRLLKPTNFKKLFLERMECSMDRDEKNLIYPDEDGEKTFLCRRCGKETSHSLRSTAWGGEPNVSICLTCGLRSFYQND